MVDNEPGGKFIPELYFNAHVHVYLINWWNQKAVMSEASFWTTVMGNGAKGVAAAFFVSFCFAFFSKEDIACQHSLVGFIILCLTLLPVADNVATPRPQFFIPSVRIVLNSENLFLKLVVSSQSRNNVEELNVISTSSKLCMYSLNIAVYLYNM